MKTFERALAAIAVGALGVRIMAAFASNSHGVRGDAQVFHLVAQHLADGNGFRQAFRDEPTAEHPPLWEVVLAGADLVGGNGFLSHRLLGAVIGTVTLGIDSSIGILADEVFKDQIDLFRNRGAKVCEISKLAFDPTVRSKMALGSLFHILYIYAHHLYQCTDAFIEINPRHRRYYEHMLGFKTLTEVRSNPRVDAPAYLLWLSLEHMGNEIERLGGTSDNPGTERSLYPYFFSKREEIGIANRLFNIG